MHIDLSGRTAVVTGSTGGIGRAIAESLARAGAAVVVNGRGEERVARAAEEIAAAAPGAKVSGVAADLAVAEGCAVFCAKVPQADILVNNLGTAFPKAFADITDADWLNLFQMNVMSGVRMTRHYLPAMVERGWGRVVFISSESGLNVPKEMIDYGMTKTAQLAIANGLARSVARTGVTVNCVLPGPTMSEGLTRHLGEAARAQGVSVEAVAQQFLAQFRPTSLIGRFASCEEVANLVTYVCSEQASATTGAALRVDGGVLAHIG